ncbi:hypothetical protein M9Y10_041130 [Tritrichomonas musculus]|uniref:Uncharacterized protein n=1 Tax=Tritrichomonas musculus TaxID=1915356 RepID=A0ABR2K4F3_9EUKA
MSSNLTEYQDRYWNYDNPFEIENDEFEKLVQSRNNTYRPNKRFRKKPQPKKANEPPKNQKKIKFADDKKTVTNPKSYQRKPKKLYLHKNQSTFVSSETKPLRKTPRVIPHYPTPVQATIRYESSSTNSV